MSKYQYTVKGVDYDVEIEEIEGDVAKVSVNGIPFEVVLKQPVRTMPKPAVKPQVQKPVAATVAAPKQEAPAAPKPAAGTVTSVLVNRGDTVMEGATLVTIA